MYIELTFFGRDLVKNYGFKNYIYSSCHYCQGVGTEVALTQHPPITVVLVILYCSSVHIN